MSQPFIAVYHGSLGIPMLWEDDGVGDLKQAVLAFLRDDGLTEERFRLVVSYLRYFLYAPCWMQQPDGERKKAVCVLRFKANELRTTRDVWALMADCLEIGLDPL